MRTLKTAVIVLSNLALMLPVDAETELNQHNFTWSSEYMLPVCSELLKKNKAYTVTKAVQERNFREGECGGVVKALVYFHKTLPAPVRFCRPQRFNIDEALGIVIAYLETHPEAQKMPFPRAAGVALQAAWPCP